MHITPGNTFKKMKHKYPLLIITCLALCFTACKKDKNYPIAGKWQETKLRVYTQNSNGAILTDTTYLASTFSNLDYVQFNNNGTGVIGSSGWYYEMPQNQVLVANTQTFSFAPVGSRFALTLHLQNNSNMSESSVADTLSDYSANTLTIHSVYYFENPSVPKTMSDAYYSK